MENKNKKENKNQINYKALAITIILLGLTFCLTFYDTPEYSFLIFELTLIISAFVFLRFKNSGGHVDGTFLSVTVVIISLWVGAMSSSLDDTPSLASCLGKLACQSGATSYCKKEPGSCPHGCAPAPEAVKPQ